MRQMSEKLTIYTMLVHKLYCLYIPAFFLSPFEAIFLLTHPRSENIADNQWETKSESISYICVTLNAEKPHARRICISIHVNFVVLHCLVSTVTLHHLLHFLLSRAAAYGTPGYNLLSLVCGWLLRPTSYISGPHKSSCSICVYFWWISHWMATRLLPHP